MAQGQQNSQWRRNLPANSFSLSLILRSIPVLLLTRPTWATPKATPANFARPVSITVTPLPTASLPATTEFTETAPALQTTSTDAAPITDGVINTSLVAPAGQPTVQPFPSVPAAIPTTSIDASALPTSPSLPTIAGPTTATKANILAVPINTDPPPSVFLTRADHPVQPANISGRSGPLHTNKFYANLLLGDQRNPIWPQPYSLWWAKDGNSNERTGLNGTYGLAISNIPREQLVFGDPVQPGDPPKYFTAPLFSQQMVLSALELGAETVLSTDSHKQFSVNVNFAPSVGAVPKIRFPVVQGMGFISGLYADATPVLQSAAIFTDVVEAGVVNAGETYKWIVKLKDGTQWLVYVTPNGATGRPPLVLSDPNTITGPAGFIGLIQVAKNTADACGETTHDEAAGAYAISTGISASVEGSVGTYSFTFERGGAAGQKLLMYALPHHVKSMAADTLAKGTCVNLWTTTKGMARGIYADVWTLQENDLPIEVGFDPYRPDLGTIRQVSTAASDHIVDAASKELAHNIDSLTNLDSAYFGGKALSKYALVAYTANKLGRSPELAAIGLRAIEAAFERWLTNRQIHPFAYDPIWGGIVSTASYNGGDRGLDFGNTIYNDHHFHYGYFVHAASIIAYLHPEWLKQGQNKLWVDTLVRDYANPDAGDPWFPASRSFDWWNGHSWATGLDALQDGKNEESSSEDAFAAYAMKMWGKVTGDPNMEARGNLQLAVLKNSLNNYFLYETDNAVQPATFAAHKNSGILFENKIDHTTFFGPQAEYVQGIHMLPISPITPYIKSSSFVASEWSMYFQSQIPLYAEPDAGTGIIPARGAYAGGWNCTKRIGTGRLINCAATDWQGVLMANLAQIDPQLAWQYFTDEGFNGEGFDWRVISASGSRTWYLAYAAAFGGAGVNCSPQRGVR